MSRSKLVGILGGCALILGSVTVALAVDIPADKEKITINKIEGKKGEVQFPHKKHATEIKIDGKNIACKRCHHTLAADAPKDLKEIKACTECHVKAGAALKKVGDKEAPAFSNEKMSQKSVLFHKVCRACHKEHKDQVKDKKIASCKNCHPKKK